MKELSIQKFKCVRDLKLENLGRVNLFTGKNNCGKTTILEAISLYAQKSNLSWVVELLKKRGTDIRSSDNETPEQYLDMLSLLFYNRSVSFNDENSIRISSEEGFYNLRPICYIEEEEVTDDNEILRKRTVLEEDELQSVDEVLYGLEIRNESGNQIIPLKRLMNGPYLMSRFMSSVNHKFHLIDTTGEDVISNASLWDNITLSEKEDIVVDALKLIEPNVTRLSFVSNDKRREERYPIIKLKDEDIPCNLKSMGDGVNRILTLILALVNSDKGFLLIDEFENGLHYSIQEKLWESIFKLSKKLDIKVFATTHSNDSVVSFARVMQNKSESEGALFRLEKKEDDIKAFSFSKDELRIAAEQDIELR
jgi:AAA15 family ATPase/GTPase